MIIQGERRLYEQSDLEQLKKRLEKVPVAGFEAITGFRDVDGTMKFTAKIHGRPEIWYEEQDFIAYLKENSLWAGDN